MGAKKERKAEYVEETYGDQVTEMPESGEKKEKKEQLRSKVQTLVSYYEEEKRRNEELTMEIERLKAEQQRGAGAPPFGPPQQGPGFGQPPLGMPPQGGMMPPPQGFGMPGAPQPPFGPQAPQSPPQGPGFGMPGMQPPQGPPPQGGPQPPFGQAPQGLPQPPQGAFGPPFGPPPQGGMPPQGPMPPAGQPPFGPPPPQGPGVSAPNYTLQSIGNAGPNAPYMPPQPPFGRPPQPPGMPPQEFGPPPQGGMMPPGMQGMPGGLPSGQQPFSAPMQGGPFGQQAKPEGEALSACLAQVLQTIEQVRAKLHQAESIRGGYGYPPQPAYVDAETVNLLDKLYDQLGDLSRELQQQRGGWR